MDLLNDASVYNYYNRRVACICIKIIIVMIAVNHISVEVPMLVLMGSRTMEKQMWTVEDLFVQNAI